MDRKDFLKNTCLAGACLCGFSSLAFSNETARAAEKDDAGTLMMQEWITHILTGIDQASLGTEQVRAILKRCATAHYKNLKMDEMLAGYKGNLEKFLETLKNMWGWKIEYDKEAGIILVDENKNFCVCPMVNLFKDFKSSALCYCSEGFAEKMFSEVVGSPVKGEVIASIKRGDQTCKYKIVIEKS